MGRSKAIVRVDRIERRILLIRGEKVILDTVLRKRKRIGYLTELESR